MGESVNLEAEQAVLGSILLNPGSIELIEDVLVPSDFSSPSNQVIYEAMQIIRVLGSPPDMILLSDQLQRSGQFQSAGGLGYLASLEAMAPESRNIVQYASIVCERSCLRSVAALGRDLERYVGQGRALEEILSEGHDRLQRLGDRTVEPSYRKWEHAAQEYWDGLDELAAGGNLGLPTGYIDLDKLTGGMQKEDLIVLGGRPSSGKSAFALNIAHRVARMGGRVHLHSLEMSMKTDNLRLLALEARVEFEKLRDGKLDDEERNRVAVAVAASRSQEIYIDDSTNLTIKQISSRIRRESPDLLIVDYLGFVKSESDGKFANRVTELDQITLGLKEIAKSMGIPVIVISQLSRKVDERSDHRPINSDLRESGGIEQNADQIWLMYREAFYDKETVRPYVADLEITKHRNGKRGMVHMFVKDDLMQFLDFAPAPEPAIEQRALEGGMPF